MRRNVIHGQLIDDVVNTYLDWHQQSERVWRAYHDWSTTAPPDTVLHFAAYVAELDREHRASDAYADAVTRAAGCGPTSALPSLSELDELFRPA